MRMSWSYLTNYCYSIASFSSSFSCPSCLSWVKFKPVAVAIIDSKGSSASTDAAAKLLYLLSSSHSCPVPLGIGCFVQVVQRACFVPT